MIHSGRENTQVSAGEFCGSNNNQSPSADRISRAIYAGEIGAKNWLALSHQSSYLLKGADPFNLGRNCLAALAGMRANTFVSLGPGDGLRDVALVKALKVRAPELTYLPVEVSQRLLDETIVTLGDTVRIPMGLLCDFETDPDFIDQAVREYGDAPVLYAMLGGTICNLDFGEASLLGQFGGLMQPDDRFLLDIPLAGRNWTPEKEPRLDAANYTPEYIRLLAGGLVNRGIRINVDSFVVGFADRVRISVSDEGYAGARRFAIEDRGTGELIVNLKRYDWDSLHSWLRSQGFTVHEGFSTIGDDGIFGMGVVLLSVPSDLPPRRTASRAESREGHSER